MITIEKFLSDLANSDIKLWVEVSDTVSEEVRLRCNAPKGALAPEIRVQLAERKVEIITFLQQGHLESNSTSEVITPVERNFDLPLSFAQARLWFLSQLEGESAAYNIPMTLRLVGSLDVVALEMAVQEIVRRHEALRTSFKIVNGSPVQVINDFTNVNISIIHLEHLKEDEQSAEVQKLASKDFQTPFSLDRSPLLRVTLLRLGEQSHVLLLTVHHIVSDGWSMGIFIRELSCLYEGFCMGQPVQLPQLPIQYVDFAHWQQQWLSGEVLQTQLDYWKRQLTGAPPLLELPTDRPRPSVQTFVGGYEEFQLNRQLTQKLKTLSQQSGVSLFMTLLTAFVILLSRYSGQEDIVIGSLIANRNRREIESVIGFFVNILVLRTQVHGNPTFSELLERVRDITLGAYDHQDLPFEKLIEELQPERSLSYAPLYQVMFALQNASAEELELTGLTLTPIELDDVTARDDLLLSIEETELGLLGAFVYKSDLFDATTIKRMAGHFETLLESIVDHPQQPVAQLSMLSAAEQHQLLVEWNDTNTEYSIEHCFPQLFETQVAKTPNAIAVVYEDQQLTYQQLNARANRWARHLVERGVGAETIVALLCDRNIDFLTAMLAVFKAGGAYLPLNPLHPPERINQVLSQSQVPLLLAASNYSSLVGNLDILLLLEDLDCQEYPSQNLPIRCNQDNLAYTIYTSGSTGKPKGVMIEHRGMLNHLYAKVTDLQLNSNDVVAQTATQTFDISIWQFLVALLVGGRVEIIHTEIASDPAELMSLVERQQISILEIVPSLLRMVLQDIENGYIKPYLSKLRWLLLTGETLAPQLCRQWLNYYPTIPMMNAYGPTECSDDVTHYPIDTPPPEEILNLPIGRPVSNTQLYILDTQLQPLPVGVAGELYVGGVGVGRGYLHNSTLTQQAFVENPFQDATCRVSTSSRLYKTGDKARFLPDGNIEFLGRIDYQVKIRGFRIELGEIEAVLSQHPQVKEAVAIASVDQSGNQHLVAYIVPNQAISATSEVRNFLKEKLPDYMVPSVVITLEKMPLTSNGKVDRRALPAPDVQLSLTAGFAPPRTPTQEVLVNLWAEVLNLKQIGIHNNFFELGGHSLLATQVISRLRSLFEVDLPLRSLFESPTIAELSESISTMRHAGLGLKASAIEPASRNIALPLSFAQARLWFLNQLEGKTSTYNIPMTLRLAGSLNQVAMSMSVQKIVQRHEVLRTTFKMVNGSPVQVITDDANLGMSVIDLQHLEEAEQSVEVERLANEEAQYPFDLSNDQLLRVTLLRLGEESHVLLLTVHHIVSDGWSMGIFIQELSSLYQAFCAGQPSPLPELPIQYADFTCWQREWLSGEVLETQLNYWKQQLTGAPPLLELPTDRPRPSVQTFQSSSEEFQLNRELTSKLKALSQRSGTTLFMTLLAAYVTLLSRYSGQEDIVVGSPIANRNRNEVESLVGFFVNILVLRTQLHGNPTFSELLERVREMTLGAYDHQDLPFEKLVEELQPERSLSHTPLFQVMFMLQNASVEEFELPGLTISPLELESSTTTDDLLLSIEETEDGLTGDLTYNSTLFDASTIKRMVEHFQILVESIVADPQQRVAQLSMLSTTERHQLLVEWNDTHTEYPLEQCFPQLFEQQVTLTPDAVAVVFENQQLTYHELNARANIWARYLVEQGVGAETVVALLCDRNIDFLTAILAVFKAGGAYLPLNPNHPSERLQQILDQSQVPFVIVTSQLEPVISQTLNRLGNTQMLLLDELALEGNNENLPIRCNPDNLAYLIYTSGSTGKPKGAMLEHRGMLNHLYAKVTDLQLSQTDVVAQTAPQSFDISVWQFLAVLLVGGKVEIVPNEMVAPAELLALVEQKQISILEIVPSLLRMMLQQVELLGATQPQMSNLRWLLLTGETLPPQLCRQWCEYYPTIPMMNAYGPTECSDDVTHYPIHTPPPAEVLNLPIGYPVANTQLYILDTQLQPVPIGVAGELYVGGVGVGRGYLYNEQQTQLAFIENPFGNATSSRLYKTGDKARYLSDGNIEFLGRIDYQVKIRGFRIELGEIEAVLGQHPQVEEVVVIAREDQPGNQHLVGYVVGNEAINNTSGLRNYLKEKLPDYMVPSAIVALETMPLTPNGKVDRRALPAPDIQLSLINNFVAPRTPVQEIIAKVWGEILNLKQVGIYDNFFEMGGHSLLATQVISRLRSLFEVDLPLRSLFESPTIEELSESIRTMRHAGLGLQTSPIVPIPRNTDLPASFAQTRLWFLDQLEENTATYNMPMTLQLVGSLNVTALSMSVQEILRRHEALRTTFKMVNGSPVQVIADAASVTIPIIDLQHLTEVEQTSEAGRLATEEAQCPFDLANGPLVRVTLLRLGEESHVLLLTIHHIVSDGWSMGIFIQELSEFYQTFCAGQPKLLPELPIQYADFAHWQREWLSGEILQTQLNYWKQQLTGAPPLLELPTDRPRPSVQTFQSSSEEFKLNRELTSQLKAISQQSGTTLFMTLLAAYATLLSRYSGQDDIVVGSPIANRNRDEIEPLIGFFVNMLVLRTQLHGNPTFTELLERVREMTLGAYDHQDLPFEKLIEELQPERSLSYTPLFQVMFMLEPASVEELEMPGLSITPLGVEGFTTTDDLLLAMEETEDGLRGDLTYNNTLFDASTIKQMVGHFQALLESIVTNPQQRIAQLPMLSASERNRLLVEWNDTHTEYPLEQCFPQLFEQQVAKTPEAVAVVFENQQLTYRELNTRANGWARYLVKQGVGAETVVALLCDRNLDFLTAILAVFKAGGAYLPLNPNHPSERLQQVLDQSQVPFVLTTNQLKPISQAISNLDSTPQILLVEELANLEGNSENLTVRCNPDNLAYLIYTSGSTGKPKGAMLEHRGMLNHLYAKVTDLQLSQTDVVAQTAPQSFDISVWQFLAVLLVGGRVEIIPNEMVAPAQLLTLVETQAISILEIVPSLLRMMLQHVEILGATQPQMSHLRWLLLTGETLAPQLCRQWFEYYPTIPMMNAYGPTECSDDVTHYPIYQPPALEVLNLPIGYPVANTQLYILDAQLQPLPIGVAGELYVGGAGVGRGYLHNAQQTQLAFVENPFQDATCRVSTSSRLYKTGDKARYLSDGNIEFLGRIDYQVKIRGFRIELGEIEAVLGQHPQVEEVVVIAREDQPGNQHLVAYVAVKEEIKEANILRNFLKEKLPDYMVPSAIVILETMPLTPNGKVDRRALPAPDIQFSLTASFAPPRDNLELQLTQIWEEVLNIHPIGIRDNFFDLGGHSLLAISLIAKIQSAFGKNLSLAAFFQGATIESLANILRSSTVSPSWSTLVTIQSGGSKQPFFCVHPGAGTVLAYVDLALNLGSEQPFYGLESLGLEDEQKPYGRVEDIAAHYIEAMQTVQPQGPYRLGGWSFGGLVAFEIAQQLQAQGQEVSLLALLDTSAVVDSEESQEQDEREYDAFLEELLASNNSSILGLPPELNKAQTQRLVNIFKSHIIAGNSYRYKPYQGKVTLFLAEEGLTLESKEPTLGWGNLAQEGVDIHWIPGDHLTMVSKPNVEILAQKLQHCLDNQEVNDGDK